jgi:hypothetical protein
MICKRSKMKRILSNFHESRMKNTKLAIHALGGLTMHLAPLQ